MFPLPVIVFALGSATIVAVKQRQRKRMPVQPAAAAVGQQRSPETEKVSDLLENVRDGLVRLDRKYQELIQTHLDRRLVGHARETQMQAISHEGGRELSPNEKNVNRSLALGTVGLGLVGLGQVTALPVTPVVVAIGLYNFLPGLREAYRIAVDEHRLSIVHLLLGYGVGSWFSGQYAVGMVGLLAASLFWKTQLLTQVVTRHSLTHILGERPQKVWVVQEGIELEIPFDRLQVGDILVLDAGQTVPVDGVIVKGTAVLDQQRLTGESQPVEKEVGDRVLAATLMLGGRIRVRVEKTGAETAAAQIGEVLNRTVESHQVKLADQFRSMEYTLVPTLAGGALGWLIAGPATAFCIMGCNYLPGTIPLGMLTMLNGLDLASRRGILIKDGRALHRLPAVDTLVFDKTGTLTLERPEVVGIHVAFGWEENAVLRLAAAAEHKQSHPIAQAILAAARARRIEVPAIDEAYYEIGSGLTVKLDGRQIRVGSQRFMETAGLRVTGKLGKAGREGQEQGHSLVFVAVGKKVVGAIEFAAMLRPETRRVVQWLKGRDLKLYILSGDQEAPTRELAAQLGMNGYFANTLPEQKAERIKELQRQGHSVCFVGDGINDAVALRQADVSISLRGATTVATDAAQVVLMEDHLEQIRGVLELAESYNDNLRNFTWQAKGLTLAGVSGVLLLPQFKFRLVQMLYIAQAAVGVPTARRRLLDGTAESGAADTEQGTSAGADG